MQFTVRPLEEHPDRVRIHKLLYFVYTQSWMSDVSHLNGLSIQRLVAVLWAETGSVEQLQHRLTQSAEQLNKVETYLRVAHLIVKILQKQRPVQKVRSPLPVDRFQLRYALMQVVNPFKAKLMLFALYHAHQHPRSPLKSSMVNQFGLDELLRKVMQCYPSLIALESGIKGIEAQILEIEATERIQLADTLTSVLGPYLSSISPGSAGGTEDVEISQDELCTLLVASDPLPDLALSQES